MQEATFSQEQIEEENSANQMFSLINREFLLRTKHRVMTLFSGLIIDTLESAVCLCDSTTVSTKPIKALRGERRKLSPDLITNTIKTVEGFIKDIAFYLDSIRDTWQAESAAKPT